MLFEIFAFLVRVGVTLVGGACLVRVLMRWRRISFVNPIGRLVLVLSDWMVVPLSRLLPASSTFDAASLLAVWLLELIQYALLMTLIGTHSWSALPVIAVIGVARLSISMATVIIVVATILSWTRNQVLFLDILERLAEPFLAPLRHALPLLRGLDFSPLIAVIILQVVGIVLASWQVTLLGSQTILGLG